MTHKSNCPKCGSKFIASDSRNLGTPFGIIIVRWECGTTEATCQNKPDDYLFTQQPKCRILQLERIVADYGWHKPECECVGREGPRDEYHHIQCSCGWLRLIAELEKKP